MEREDRLFCPGNSNLCRYQETSRNRSFIMSMYVSLSVIALTNADLSSCCAEYGRGYHTGTFRRCKLNYLFGIDNSIDALDMAFIRRVAFAEVALHPPSTFLSIIRKKKYQPTFQTVCAFAGLGKLQCPNSFHWPIDERFSVACGVIADVYLLGLSGGAHLQLATILRRWIITTWTLSIVVQCSVTALLSYRIWKNEHHLQAISGHNNRSAPQHMAVIWTIVESGAIYSAATALLLLLYLLKMNAGAIIGNSIGQIAVSANNLL